MGHKEMLGERKNLMSDKQLSIPGMPAPEPKPQLISREAQLGLRLNSIESRLLKLELEVSLLRILVEKGREK